MADAEFAIRKADEHVVLAENDRGKIDLCAHARSHDCGGVNRLQGDFCLLHGCKGDLHSTDGDFTGRRGGAGFFIAADAEAHQRGCPARHFEIGIAVVDPSAHSLCRPVGEREKYVDHDAVVVEGDGNGNGIGLRRRSALRGQNTERNRCEENGSWFHGKKPFKHRGWKARGLILRLV